jgi:hypothetical protein
VIPWAFRRRVVQLRQNASILEQGCAGFSPGSANRYDQFMHHPRRTSSPLRPRLSCRYTQQPALRLSCARQCFPDRSLDRRRFLIGPLRRRPLQSCGHVGIKLCSVSHAHLDTRCVTRRRTYASGQASQFSADQVLQHLLVERQISDQRTIGAIWARRVTAARHCRRRTRVLESRQ